MRTFPENFQDQNLSPFQEPRYTVALSFSDDNSTGKTNVLLQSDDFSTTWAGSAVVTTNTDTDPAGDLVADTVDDNSAGSTLSKFQAATNFDVTKHYTFQIKIKKDAIGRATRFPRIRLHFTGSVTENNLLDFDTATGETNFSGASTDPVGRVDSYNADWWIVSITAKSTNQSNTQCNVYLYPARGASATWVNSATATGSVIACNAQLSESAGVIAYAATTTAAILTGSADTDVYWITSHADALVLPGVPADAKLEGAIIKRGITGTTQKIDYAKGRFSIGGSTVRVADLAGAFSDKINEKLGINEGLRYKRIRIYKGHASLTAWDDYALLATYIVTSIEYNNAVYTIKSSDVQRIAKQDIFEPHQGVLTESITADATEIPVTVANAINKFLLVEHDANYSANPSDSVGYVKIEDEVICHDGWTDANRTHLNVIERGAFRTLPAAHVVTETEITQRKKVTEYFYIEGAAPRLAYYLLNGSDPAAVLADLPDHWHAGIPASLIRLSDFTGIGSDLWDTATSTGRRLRFIGIESTEAKRFVETEICVWLNCFLPVYADGTLGLRRFGGVLPESGHSIQADENQIVKGSALRHDFKALVNNIAIRWNWNARLERFLKVDGLIDADSITKHGQAALKVYEFSGVFLGINSDSDIFNFFTEIRDRFSNPPILREITLIPEFEVVEVGDTIRVIDQHCRDYNSLATLDRTMMVLKTRHDWATGLVTLSLFGGIEKSTEAVVSDSDVLLDTYYTTGGTELSTVLTISAGAITANGTLNGSDDATASVFYFDGNLTLNAGITLTLNRNLLIRVKGTFTNNGTIDIDGNAADGTLGATNTGYSVWCSDGFGGSKMRKWREGNRTSGLYENGLPVFNILNPDGLSINGVPGDLSGVDGAVGATAFVIGTSVAGGAGGIGGGGAVIVCRGMAMGPSSEIDMSGTAGTAGSAATVASITARAQTGGGGFPGGLLVLIDGNYSAPVFTSTNVTALKGAQAVPASVDLYHNETPQNFLELGQEGYGQPIVDNNNYWQAVTRIQYIPPAQDDFLFLPEDDRRSSNPRRRLTDLLINNLQQLVTNPDGPFQAAVARPGLFVVAGLSSGTDTEILTSPDGRNWTERSNPGTASGDDAFGICAGAGYFVIAMSGFTTGAIMHSTDGITWTKVTPTNHNGFNDVAFGNGVFVLVGNDDATDASLFTATDPATWTERANPKAFDLAAVVYSLELDLWIAGGQADGTDAYLITATDPTSTWTERANPVNGNIQGLAAGNGLVVAVGSNAAGTGPYIIYSSDGITWTEVTTYPVTDETLNRVRFFDGVFYAVGTFDDTTVGATLWLSEDAITWYRVPNVSPNQLEDIAFDGARFVLPIGTNQEGILLSPRVDTL